MTYHPRRRRPYQRKQASKAGAIIFGIGLLAMLATMAILALFLVPGINRRLEYLPLYAQSYYRKLVPHPEFLPTPAPAVAFGGNPNSGGSVKLALPPVPLHPTPTPAANLPTAQEASVNLPDASTGDTLPETAPQPEPAAVPPAPTDEQVQLSGFNHQWQTWNNCGPATITINTSYFGRPETQEEAARFLKPNTNDKNVNPEELATYARTLGLEAMVRQGGSVAQLKEFVSNGFPVLVETWLIHDGDGLGHYRLITGFDDAAGYFITEDSLSGPQVTVPYDLFDADWRVFNRLYLVVYPAQQGGLVHGIIGADMDEAALNRRLVQQAQAEIKANPADAIAWFNQGDALTRLQQYQEAAAAFDQARQLGLHWRRLWYQFTPFEAYYAVGRYQDVLDLAAATLTGSGGLEEAYYFQGLALHATGQDGAADAFRAALAYNANFAPAQTALDALAAE